MLRPCIAFLLLVVLFWSGFSACTPSQPATDAATEQTTREGTLRDGQRQETPADIADAGSKEPVAEDSPDLSDAAPPELVQEVLPEITPDASPVPTQEGKWVWVDVPGSRCGYGTQTGFAINASAKSDVLYLYLQGGGACWKDRGAVGNCFALQPSAFNLRGYDKKKFETDGITKTMLGSFFFKRSEPTNPFAKAHHVFIPYCTGDVFAGNATVQYGNNRKMHFHGHRNMKLFLASIKATFPTLKRIVIAGSSAGGFGAAFNWGLTQQVFGKSVVVDLLDDSGPPMEPAGNLWNEWRNTWKIVPPPGCKDCLQGVDKILDFYASTLLKEGRRMAFLSFDRDAVIRSFFGLNDLTGRRFKDRLELLLKRLDRIKGVEYFVLPGSRHTMLISSPQFLRNSKKVDLSRWIEWFFKKDPAWTSHRN